MSGRASHAEEAKASAEESHIAAQQNESTVKHLKQPAK